MDETVELTLGKYPSLKVTGYFKEETLDPDPAAVQRLVKSVKSVRLPAAPNGSLDGIDGYTYTLRFIDGHSISQFSWWSHPPTGWEPLARIAKRMIGLSGPKIPMAGY